MSEPCLHCAVRAAVRAYIRAHGKPGPDGERVLCATEAAEKVGAVLGEIAMQMPEARREAVVLAGLTAAFQMIGVEANFSVAYEPAVAVH